MPTSLIFFNIGEITCLSPQDVKTSQIYNTAATFTMILLSGILCVIFIAIICSIHFSSLIKHGSAADILEKKVNFININFSGVVHQFRECNLLVFRTSAIFVHLSGFNMRRTLKDNSCICTSSSIKM
jgi:hypothetical protein